MIDVKSGLGRFFRLVHRSIIKKRAQICPTYEHQRTNLSHAHEIIRLRYQFADDTISTIYLTFE